MSLLRAHIGHAFALLATLILSIGSATSAFAAAEPLPRDLDGVDVQENLGGSLDISLPFRDHEGRDVRLGEYFKDTRPVLLSINYYNCTMLCSLQLNAMVDGLKALGWVPGKNYRVLTVSMDHTEDHTLAAGKRKSYLDALGMGDVDWTFLVGEEASVRKLTGQLGFGFRYIEDIDEFAHPAVLHFVSPDGRIIRYLYGLDYNASNLKFALMEAAEGRIGTPFERLILSCFHYDPNRNSYVPYALGIMKVASVLTVIVLSLVLLGFWTHERRQLRTVDDAA